nr:Hsp70 family protein [Mycolicibacterium phlei]
MSDSLGLSIGSTNLVAARVGHPPVIRRSVLTLFDNRPPEVGVPGENPNLNQPGLVLSGFVERVGDPVPLVAADGSPHRGEQVLAEALAAMARAVGGGAPITIAFPAHWGPAAVGALRGALRAVPALSPDGIPPALVPDSLAALAALRNSPGLPSAGVVVLCDFGGSGTSITLADAAANFAPIGETIRYPDFSGDQIDQLLLNHVLAGLADAGGADPAGTAAVSSLARLRAEARLAKERLSAETATVVRAELPNATTDVRVTRTELEQLIAAPLDGVLTAIEEALHRNNIPPANIAAVATVGGGANIPLVTQQLSTRLRAPVVTTQQSQLLAATGAALMADAAGEADAPTGLAPAAADAPTGLAPAADAPTSMWPPVRRVRRPPNPLPTERIQRRSGRWPGPRTSPPAPSRCRMRVRTTRSSRARRVRGPRWTSRTRRSSTSRSCRRCRGTAVRPRCSGWPPPRRCWRSAGWR